MRRCPFSGYCKQGCVSSCHLGHLQDQQERQARARSARPPRRADPKAQRVAVLEDELARADLQLAATRSELAQERETLVQVQAAAAEAKVAADLVAERLRAELREVGDRCAGLRERVAMLEEEAAAAARRAGESRTQTAGDAARARAALGATEELSEGRRAALGLAEARIRVLEADLAAARAERAAGAAAGAAAVADAVERVLALLAPAGQCVVCKQPGCTSPRCSHGKMLHLRFVARGEDAA